jgi:hypothetical protein
MQYMSLGHWWKWQWRCPVVDVFGELFIIVKNSGHSEKEAEFFTTVFGDER